MFIISGSEGGPAEKNEKSLAKFARSYGKITLKHEIV